MFDRFSEAALRALFFSRYEAGLLGHTAIEAEHLLLGLLGDDVRRELDLRPAPQATPATAELPLSEEVQQILAYAVEESERSGDREVRPAHLVLAYRRVRGRLE